MKLATLLFALLSLGTARAETLGELLACHQSLTAPVADQFASARGDLVCDGSAKECFYARKDGSTYRAKLSDHPTFTVKEVNFDMTDHRQVIEHRLITFTEPTTKTAAYVDVFWGENNRAFARNLMQANPHRLDTLTFVKAKPDALESLVKRRITEQLSLLKVMIEKKEGQPGVGLEGSKKDWLDRMSRCDGSEVAQKLRQEVGRIK
jgi:hypothetical protein